MKGLRIAEILDSAADGAEGDWFSGLLGLQPNIFKGWQLLNS